MADFSIIQLFQQAFGDRGVPYDASVIGEDQEGTEFLEVRDTLQAKLPDGRPIFMPLAIGGVKLPNEPTIRVTRRKEIVTTSLVGSSRSGSVKELIRQGDWEIIIRGIAVNAESTQIYPEDQVAQLNDLNNRAESLEVDCALFSLLGIYRLVIVGFDLPEMVGIQHAQAYEFRCWSDEDFILEIE